METLNRLNLTDLITASRAHAHTARRLAKAHRRSRVRSRLARLDLSGKFIGNKASFVIFNFRKYRGKYAYPSQKVALAPREISG